MSVVFMLVTCAGRIVWIVRKIQDSGPQCLCTQRMAISCCTHRHSFHHIHVFKDIAHRLQTPLSNSHVGGCRKICLLVRIVQDIGILPILWLKNYFAKTICLFVCNEHTTIINRRVQSKCAPQKGSTAITISRQVTSTYCTQQTASAYSSRWSLDAGATTSIINRRVQSKCAPQKSSPAITTSRQVTSAYCTQQTASAFSSR